MAIMQTVFSYCKSCNIHAHRKHLQANNPLINRKGIGKVFGMCRTQNTTIIVPSINIFGTRDKIGLWLFFYFLKVVMRYVTSNRNMQKNFKKIHNKDYLQSQETLPMHVIKKVSVSLVPSIGKPIIISRTNCRLYYY